MARAARSTLPVDTCVFTDVMQIWSCDSTKTQIEKFEGLDSSSKVFMAHSQFAM